MDIKDLNKHQLILLALLLSFVTSLATGITTVTLMQQAPDSVSVPITKVIRQTVEKISPDPTGNSNAVLSEDQQKLLKQMESFQSLYVSIYLDGDKDKKNIGNGLLLGGDQVILNSILPELKTGEAYIAKSIFGEKKISNIKSGEGYSVVHLENTTEPLPSNQPKTPETPINP